MLDFANSGYTTVVLTTVFNAYFVAVVVGSAASGTLLWTVAVGVGNCVVVVTAPLLGAIADRFAAKKRLLIGCVAGCVATTALLGTIGPGDVTAAMVLIVASLVCFASGEYLIAAFLPEIVPQDRIGRMSAYGWSLGYVGGLTTLAMCLGYIGWARARGLSEAEYVPITLAITAAMIATAALPAFLFLRERAVPRALPAGESVLRAAFADVASTLSRARARIDLFRFLLALVVFQAGVNTVIVLTAVYARSEFGLGSSDLVLIVLVVNVAAAFGSLAAGWLQDRAGSVRALGIALAIWIVALVLVWRAVTVAEVWIAANVIGFALGASQSGSRAFIGKLTPATRTAEFFGLWAFTNRLASIVGPLTYGLISYFSGGDQHLALVATAAFFAAGLALLTRVDERRGIAAAAA